MLTTDILPVAQKLREQARNMAKEEEIFQQKKRSRHADGEDTSSIQEVYTHINIILCCLNIWALNLYLFKLCCTESLPLPRLYF